MRLFDELIAPLPRPAHVLDVGGTEGFWRHMGLTDDQRIEVLLLNHHLESPEASNIKATTGDARDLSRFDDHSFDVVFSNSVIEHLGTWEDQGSMAREVRRVARHYFVQTPNRYFPLEPHFFFPGFQFLPIRARVGLVRRFALGYHDALPDPDEARRAVTEIRLLTVGEMRRLFPDARLYRERVAGLTKSIVAYGGWEP
jgi:hypothetical protein